MLFPKILMTGTEAAGFYPSIVDPDTKVEVALQSDFGLFSLVRFWHIRRVNIPEQIQKLALQEWGLRYSPRLMPAATRTDWAIWMDNKVRAIHYE